jgi:hypothetical protein
MQIQSWEGVALSCAETVLQGTTHDTVRGNWLRRKSIAKTVVEEGGGRRDRFDGEAQRYGAPGKLRKELAKLPIPSQHK